MLQKFICAAAALVICFGVALADEIKGKVKSVDAEKGTITVTVGDKDQTLKIDKDTKLSMGKKVKEAKDIPAGVEVLLTTDKDVVKEIKKGAKKPK